MKNILGVFYSILISLLLMVGCNSQAQPTNTPTATFKPTTTPLPTATPTFLPTFTPLPSLPTKIPPPLPKGIFEPFQDSIFDPTTVQIYDDIIKTAFGIAHQDSVVEEKILVDSTMGYVVFSLFWEEGNLDLTLIQPDGKEINSLNSKSVQDFRGALMDSDPSYFISSISDPLQKKYYIFVPQTGTWTMKLSGKSTPVAGSNYMIQVTSDTATSLYNIIERNNVIEYNILQKKEYFSGNPIVLSFGITDGVSGSLLTGYEYIYGVSMHVTVEDPSKKQYSFDLYDDGLHEDGKADSGIYGNTFSNTLLVGKYNFYLQISGKNNRAKEPFTREYFFSIETK